tara:strand:- start:315 stop:2615 length:2301 start_codon:yes stop_codon:yes gene_type:complete
MKKQTNKQSKSYLAKLLATENITVEHRKVPTAFFDLKSRLLVVPIWKQEMSNDVLDLLLAHEIGHALYTPQKEWKNAIDNDKIPHSFLNVIEDARIEKLVKRKYAGLQQTFIKGYRELIQSDFFKTKDRDLNDMLLIDRLNMHFKSSHIESDIDFTSAELDIVERMKKLETFEDVKKLASELADYCTKEKEEKQIEQEIQSSGTPQIDDTEDSEGDGHAQGKENEEEENDNEENATIPSADTNEEEQEEQKVEEEPTDTASESSGQQNSDSQSESIDHQELVSETDNAWSKQSHSLLDKECKENEYFNPHEFKNLKEIVIDYKTVLKDFAKCFEHNESSYLYENQRFAIQEFKNEFNKFMSTQNKSVNYMVKEFEMKKSAAAYARTSQDKTGIINPLKLHSYKFNDDIFKRIAVTPDGKNHGMMMFIDWSGSMSDKLKNTLHQLMVLTMFCQKVKIPFEVYAFSNNGRAKLFKPSYQVGDITIDHKFHLINLASSKMRAKEFHSALMNMFHVACKHDNRLWYSYRRRLNTDYEDTAWIRDLPEIPRGYGLSSTPLNDCIMAAYKLVPAFVEKYSIDKMNTIFLTDGCSDGNNGKIELLEDNTDPYRQKMSDDFVAGPMMSYDKNSILVDRKTKKQYDCEYSWRNKNGLTENLLQILKDRTGSKVLGFYVSARKRIDNYAMDKYFSYRDRSKVHAEMRRNKVVTVTNSTGYDEIYLLVGDNMQVEDGQMATPSENAKKSEIKRLFTSTLKSNKQSRILLNKFISQVA